MENIHLYIKGQVKESMLAKDTVRLNVVRGLLTAFMNELVATGHTPQETLGDVEATKVILRTIKQREDAISQFESAGRNDLAEEDKAQLAVLKEFAPVMASDEEVMQIAIKLKESMGMTDASKSGMLIGAIKKELGDKGDGNSIKRIVDNLFK